MRAAWAETRTAGRHPHGAFRRLPEWEWARSRPVEQRVIPVDDRILEGSGPPLSATFLGHASFLLQVGEQRVLTDPVLGDGSGWLDWMGKSRFTPPALGPAELPPLDIVLLSHAHYDHTDLPTLKGILQAQAQHDRPLKWVVPLGLKPLLVDWVGVPDTAIVELDWWTATSLDAQPDPVPLPAEWAQYADRSGAPRSADAGSDHASCQAEAERCQPTSSDLPPCIVAVPAQHDAARTAWDRNDTLCVGYALVSPHGRLLFTGDTGYRAVERGVAPLSAEEDAAPVCPSFREVGDRLGPFDMGLLPIGAYSPRWFMSRVHTSPEDALEVHLDTRCRRSVGMHWGSLPLTDEPVGEPPLRLAAALEARALDPSTFVALDVGGTLTPAGPLSPDHLHQPRPPIVPPAH